MSKREMKLFLSDIDDAIAAIQSYTRDMTYEQLLADRKTREAIILNFVVIGEAIKKIPHIDAQGRRIEPKEPNGVKLESFIFDAIPLADHSIILEIDRNEQFAPVKNATGVDSAETSRRDMNRRAAAWLESAGYNVPRRPDFVAAGRYAIRPLLALVAGQLRAVLLEPPVIRPGQDHYLE